MSSKQLDDAFEKIEGAIIGLKNLKSDGLIDSQINDFNKQADELFSATKGVVRTLVEDISQFRDKVLEIGELNASLLQSAKEKIKLFDSLTSEYADEIETVQVPEIRFDFEPVSSSVADATEIFSELNDEFGDKVVEKGHSIMDDSKERVGSALEKVEESFKECVANIDDKINSVIEQYAENTQKTKEGLDSDLDSFSSAVSEIGKNLKDKIDNFDKKLMSRLDSVTEEFNNIIESVSDVQRNLESTVATVQNVTNMANSGTQSASASLSVVSDTLSSVS
tara:strand:+ start:8767 stop:9606 length:840 start_codon:yes stop_codon:yes gene_type:complete